MPFFNAHKFSNNADDLDLTEGIGDQNIFSFLAAIFIGASVPLVCSSPTVMAIASILALIFIIISPGTKILIKQLFKNLKSPLALMIVILLLSWAPSMIDSVDFEKSASVWVRTLFFIFVATVFFTFLKQSLSLRKTALRSLIIFSLLSSAIGIIAIYTYSPLLSLYRLDGLDVLDTLKTLKYYGSVEGCITVLVICAGFYLGGVWRYLSLLKCILGILLIIEVDSDSGILALIVASIACSVLIFENKVSKGRSASKGIFLILIAAATIFFLLIAKLPDIPNLEYINNKTYDEVLNPSISVEYVDTHRQYIWAFALNLALDSPVIGHGIDVSNYLPKADIVVSQFNQAFIPGHPHSWFLELFLEVGVIGLLCLIAVLIFLLFIWLRISRSQLFISMAGISILFAFWSSSMINFSIWLSWWQGVFLIITAIAFSFVPTKSLLSR
tara:strand:- start:52813 stop:54141 length:1329 start_codon:yes stop_codon:yes gene_type:complete